MSGSSNFLQIDQSKTNMLDDGSYATDAITLNGSATGSVYPSNFANKLGYQLSTFIAAFAGALAAKGYVLSDADKTTLQGVLANIKTNADFIPGMSTVAFATSMTFNLQAATGFATTLTGNVSSSTLTNLGGGGQFIIFAIAQDATGGRTFSWPTNVQGAGTVSPLPSCISLQCFVVLPASPTIARALTPMVVLDGSGTLSIQTALPNIESTASANGNVPSGFGVTFERVDATSGNITRTLYTAVGNVGKQVIIKKIDSTYNSVTIAAQSGQTIDGQASISFNLQWTSATLLCDGANWNVI